MKEINLVNWMRQLIETILNIWAKFYLIRQNLVKSTLFSSVTKMFNDWALTASNGSEFQYATTRFEKKMKRLIGLAQCFGKFEIVTSSVGRWPLCAREDDTQEWPQAWWGEWDIGTPLQNYSSSQGTFVLKNQGGICEGENFPVTGLIPSVNF